MAKYTKEETPEFRISNRNKKLKREIVNIAKSQGKTYSQFCREKLIEIAASFPESARNYCDD